MASKIQSRHFYVDITPYKVDGNEEDFNELAVSTAYDSTHKYFYVDLHAGWKTDWGGHGCILIGPNDPLQGPKYVIVKESSENSQKTIDEMSAALELAKDAIAWLFDKRDWQRLYTAVKNIALNGYTEKYRQQMEELMHPADKEDDPILCQFHELKEKHPDAILLFRHGDFYEAYEDDAKKCAKVLGITLTYRNADKLPMAGFPHHAIDTYLPKLIRAGNRVAICDPLEDPKQAKKLAKENINNSNSTTMEAKDLKAADLIGKKIVINNTNNYYVVDSVDGDTLHTQFHRGDAEPIPVPLSMDNLQKFLQANTWSVEGITAAQPTADDDVQEVENIEPAKHEPKAEPKPKQSKPKAKAEPKPKAQPKAEPATGKLTYETYTSSKGKTCARIKGFTEDAPAYVNAAELHGSASWFNKDGKKSYYIAFGPRYAAAAKQVCDALNAGKTLDDCKAIVSAATQELAQKRDEWKQKREERKAGASKPKTYTEAEVLDLMKRVAAGDAEAIAMVNNMAKAA